MYVQVIEWPTVKNPGNSLFLHLSLIKIRGAGGGGESSRVRYSRCATRKSLVYSPDISTKIF